jgi:hypothetical protein
MAGVRGCVRSGLDAGMRQFRAGDEPSGGAVAVPVTRVFSPCVVQAGWAGPRVRAGLPYSVQPGW